MIALEHTLQIRCGGDCNDGDLLALADDSFSAGDWFVVVVGSSALADGDSFAEGDWFVGLVVVGSPSLVVSADGDAGASVASVALAED